MSATCWICEGGAGACAGLAPLDFLQCRSCGFIFRPELDTTAVYEGGEYEARDFAADYAVEQTVDERRTNAQVRLTWLLQHARRGRLLDVGAAGGAFVLEAREAGFDAFGVEPAPAFARHAREVLGVDVRDGRVEDLDVAAGTLDVATLWHVLEHVPEPAGTLEVLRDRLRRDGLLVIEVPNVASVAAQRMGLAWTHLDAEVHVSQFTPRTLRTLLERAGFAIEQLTTVAHGIYLSRRERWAAAHVAHRLQLARGGAIGLQHPDRHEFLRVVARPA